MRKDAARNHAAILGAAVRLIVERGPEGFSMEDVATAAGVGKGTVFRRFGDREGLVRAVVDGSSERWRAESRELLEADHLPAEERVITYVATLFDHVVAALPLVMALERVSARSIACDADAELTHARLVALVGRVKPGADVEFLAHALLAGLRAEVVHHLVHRCGLGVARVRAGVLSVARAVLAGEAEPAGGGPSGE
ncbi:TetR/AcrR family transcriptional regulator [Saccharothrix syringae]|uniref:TetR/AcrR family transcriptional regulator n=1 Tax=Saccharothrix syringae TaxID=103733 RepID=A0A5Q0H9T2_SACSY|nr:TetR/AcrR family transcriptional regulator [Saccharothrix syringae]QFZ22685.1 TetR/AcrR family transcriptional regulator [Saccharothrix syringae]